MSNPSSKAPRYTVTSQHAGYSRVETFAHPVNGKRHAWDFVADEVASLEADHAAGAKACAVAVKADGAIVWCAVPGTAKWSERLAAHELFEVD